MVFSPDSKLLAFSGGENPDVSQNPYVTVWNVAAERELLKLGPHNGDVHSVAFSPDGRLLAAATMHGNEANLFEMTILSQYQKLNDERDLILQEGIKQGRFYHV